MAISLFLRLIVISFSIGQRDLIPHRAHAICLVQLLCV